MCCPVFAVQRTSPHYCDEASSEYRPREREGGRKREGEEGRRRREGGRGGGGGERGGGGGGWLE